eukprot:2101520-Rhodomonas_salina.2
MRKPRYMNSKKSTDPDWSTSTCTTIRVKATSSRSCLNQPQFDPAGSLSLSLSLRMQRWLRALSQALTPIMIASHLSLTHVDTFPLSSQRDTHSSSTPSLLADLHHSITSAQSSEDAETWRRADHLELVLEAREDLEALESCLLWHSLGQLHQVDVPVACQHRRHQQVTHVSDTL